MATKTKITKEQREACRFLTPEFRLSYPKLFKADAMPGGKPKFSITMLFKKTADLTGMDGNKQPIKLPALLNRAKQTAFGPKENWPANLESCVIDGDNPKFADKEGYAGHWVVKASTSEDQRPGVVNRDLSPITDPAVIYPGCFARAYVYAYVWTFANKQGVGLILDHVQKMRDGDAFGGKKPAEQVFDPISGGDAMDDETEESDDFT